MQTVLLTEPLPPLAPEEAERAAQRRVQSDGVDDVVIGIYLIISALIFVVEPRAPAFRGILIALLGGMAGAAQPFRRYLRQRISDPRLGYVRPLGEPANNWTEPIPLKGLLGAGLLLLVIVLLANADYSWLTRHVDLSWVPRQARFSGLAFAVLIALFQLFAARAPRSYVVTAAALAAGAFGAWRGGDFTATTAMVCATVGPIYLLSGAVALWRIARLPVLKPQE